MNIDIKFLIKKYITEHNPAAKILHVGAGDGTSDPISQVLREFCLNATIIEPSADLFERLLNVYSKHNWVTCRQIAATIDSRCIEMYAANEEFIAKNGPWARQITSWNRQHLIKHGLSDSDIRSYSVTGVPIGELVSENDYMIISIAAGGCEHLLLAACFDSKPSVGCAIIIAERSHLDLSTEDKLAAHAETVGMFSERIGSRIAFIDVRLRSWLINYKERIARGSNVRFTAMQTSEWFESNLRFRLGAVVDDKPRFSCIDILEDFKGNIPPDLYVINGKLKEFADLNDIRKRISKNGSGEWWAAGEQRNSVGRSCAFLNYIKKIPFDCDFLVNFADAQDYNYGTSIISSSPLPYVFQYCRRPDRRDSILFPLLNYMEPGGVICPNHLLRSNVPWSRKHSQIVWRGAPNGFASLEGQQVGLREYMIRNAQRHPKDASALSEALSLFQRGRFLISAAGSGFVDAGFTATKWIDEIAVRSEAAQQILQQFVKINLSPAEQIRYKYLACLEGFDQPSSLAWNLASDSLVLMAKPTWHTIFHTNLRAWEHYVPLADDFSDLAEKFNWCEANESSVLQIISNANEYILPYLNWSLRNQLDYMTIDNYAAKYSAGGRFSDVNFGVRTKDSKNWMDLV